MKSLKILAILFFLFSFEIAFAQKPKISLSFPESFRTNEEIEVSISISNLKKSFYDLKVSIEKDKKVLSEIYNQKEKKWQDSFYYLKNLFSGPFFEEKLKLRMKKEFLFFEGEAEMVAKVRESGKSSYTEYRKKIKILKPQVKEEKKKEFLAEIPKNVENKRLLPKIVATLTSLFSALVILTLKLKLKSLSQK